jgi:hypothetical protein
MAYPDLTKPMWQALRNALIVSVVFMIMLSSLGL